jgi:hypothetical protein
MTDDRTPAARTMTTPDADDDDADRRQLPSGRLCRFNNHPRACRSWDRITGAIFCWAMLNQPPFEHQRGWTSRRDDDDDDDDDESHVSIGSVPRRRRATARVRTTACFLSPPELQALEGQTGRRRVVSFGAGPGRELSLPRPVSWAGEK